MTSSGGSDSAGKSAARDRQRFRLGKWWTGIIALAAICLAGYLLYRNLSQYSFGELVASVESVPLYRLFAAMGFAAGSYLCLTGFDYLALIYVNKRLPYPKVALASFVSLSLGHNIGLSPFSSGAIRYRYYSRWGLGPDKVSKLVLFCGVTVGLGLAALGGAALLFQPKLSSSLTGLSTPIVIALGIACEAAIVIYLCLAAFLRRSIHIRGYELAMPHLGIAVAQVLVGSLDFAFVGACLHQALSALANLSYVSVTSAFVIANTAALFTHVPGGLGVIESVVMYLLPGQRLIGGLLVFRFVYFLLPLGLGGLMLLVSEIVFRGRKSGTGSDPAAS